MQELLDYARAEYSLILIDAPAVLSSVAAEVLTQYADTIIYAVRSRRANILVEKRCFKRLADTQTPIAGAVLTDIHELYIRS